METSTHSKTEPVQSVAWTIADWCSATSISRASFYLLASKPRAVKIGRRTVVIESPQSYLLRIAELNDSQLNAA